MGKKSVHEVLSKSKAAKEARSGKDMGKPGKNFNKIASNAGGGEKGDRIAGAVFQSLRRKGKL